MANICNFSMMVVGTEEGYEKFFEALTQKKNVYMGRGADAEIVDVDEWDEDEYHVEISGWCKWSIESSLIDDAIDMRTNPDRWVWDYEINPDGLEFLTLNEVCAKYNVNCEIYSEEPGVGFQEHYLVKDGEIVIADCVDYNEIYLRDYKTKEDAEKDLGISITDDEWENEDYTSTGGYEEWSFEI